MCRGASASQTATTSVTLRLAARRRIRCSLRARRSLPLAVRRERCDNGESGTAQTCPDRDRQGMAIHLLNPFVAHAGREDGLSMSVAYETSRAAAIPKM